MIILVLNGAGYRGVGVVVTLSAYNWVGCCVSLSIYNIIYQNL